ncbi:MAG: SOS response-associated peptidase, partial [Dehalococcoidia bacterium]
DVMIRPTPPAAGAAPTAADIEELEPGEQDRIVPQGTRQAVPSVWGLIPGWARDRTMAGKTFNARSETLMEKPSFRGLVARHRCIIPVSGFYEWSGTGKSKQPRYFHRADGRPLALAGLWTTWRDPTTGEAVTSHTIITTQANGMIAAYHQRMPVVLDDAGVALWLDPTVTDPGVVLPLLAPAPDDLLTAHRVSDEVNNARNDGPQLILPLDGDEPSAPDN